MPKREVQLCVTDIVILGDTVSVTVRKVHPETMEVIRRIPHEEFIPFFGAWLLHSEWVEEAQHNASQETH